MVRSIVYSLVAFISYFCILFVFNSLFSFILLREEFIDIEDHYIDLVETVTYFFLIFFSLIYLKKRSESSMLNFSGSSFTLVLFLAILYRVLEDPILRFSVIDGLNTVPPLSKVHYTTLASQLVTFFNLIVLAAIFEELLFRKIMLNFFTSTNVKLGVVFCSLLFALIHLKGWHLNFPILITSFVFSVLASIIYLRYDIFHSIIFHSFYNVIWYILTLNKQVYWEVLVSLNFGYYYWLIIGVAFIFFVFLYYYLFINTSLLAQPLNKK